MSLALNGTGPVSRETYQKVIRQMGADGWMGVGWPTEYGGAGLPLSAAAVILDRKCFPRGIDDSKNLPIEKREAIHARLVKCAVIGVGVASVEEIDTLNIYWARMLAMTRAVEALGVEPAWVLVDGNACPRWQRPSKAIVAGDARCRSIAAALRRISDTANMPIMIGISVRPPASSAMAPPTGTHRRPWSPADSCSAR